jgi:hypothetical protein
VREVRADSEVIDALQVELIAPQGQVVIAEEGNERLEVVAIRMDRVDRSVPLVREVIEEIADLVLQAPTLPKPVYRVRRGVLADR